jgi:hypothetical protein
MNDNVNISLASREKLNISVWVVVLDYWNKNSYPKRIKIYSSIQFSTIAKSHFRNQNSHDTDTHKFMVTEIIVILSLFSSNDSSTWENIRMV